MNIAEISDHRTKNQKPNQSHIKKSLEQMTRKLKTGNQIEIIWKSHWNRWSQNLKNINKNETIWRGHWSI